jgi:hypothetical protein
MGGVEFDGFDIDISFFKTDSQGVMAQRYGEKTFFDAADVRAREQEGLPHRVRRHWPLPDDDMRRLANEFDRQLLRLTERFRHHRLGRNMGRESTAGFEITAAAFCIRRVSTGPNPLYPAANAVFCPDANPTARVRWGAVRNANFSMGIISVRPF